MRRVAVLWVLAAALAAPAASAAEAGDPAAGQRAFIQCAACHSTAEGAPNKVGPNLHGIFGAKAATRPGYTYSPALQASGVTWTDATLDAWLTRPSALVPGTKMVFAGIPDAGHRADLIAYLKQATQ
jgi:cytochrome c